MRFITKLCMIFFLLICLLAVVVKGQLMCGRQVRNLTCEDNTCCSQYGYCGITEAYCSNGCQSNCELGRNNTSSMGDRMCGWQVRNVTCKDNTCCSQHGYCGITEDYCSTLNNCQSNCNFGRRNTSTVPDGGSDEDNGSSSSPSLKIAAIAIPTSIGGVLFLVFVCIFFMKWKTNRKSTTAGSGNIIGDAEPLQFDLVTIKIATENFSDANKLGEGGFGVVYKGELLDGQEIAVKRLSHKAGQGSEEFKNEVVLLHNLQHRNLVKLLGYCYLEAEEAILIYEYVHNRSLDKFLFDPLEKRDLDWQTRYKIIGGVARGLVYLHEDSRLKIIHRDLKAGNILLDVEMNAKIADFGLARLVGVDQTQVNASRIAGTYGYMAPEYAMHGIFSVKSDVFSFGVLLLEIVSGQKISKFHDQLNEPKDLLSYAWKHWREGTTLALMDSTLMDKFSRDEVMRCIHIALLCVQDKIEERPTMSSVVLMLNSYSLTIQSPSEPAFCYSKTLSVMFQGVQDPAHLSTAGSSTTQTSSPLNTMPS